MKDQHLLGVVEALDSMAGFAVVGAAVDVLHHVQVLGDVLEVLVLVSVEHLVHEVDVPEVPARPRLVLHLEGALDGLLHHVLPVGVLQRHDHLVNVEQGDVLVAVDVAVEAVVVGDQLQLPLRKISLKFEPNLLLLTKNPENSYVEN